MNCDRRGKVCPALLTRSSLVVGFLFHWVYTMVLWPRSSPEENASNPTSWIDSVESEALSHSLTKSVPDLVWVWLRSPWVQALVLDQVLLRRRVILTWSSDGSFVCFRVKLVAKMLPTLSARTIEPVIFRGVDRTLRSVVSNFLSYLGTTRFGLD